MERSRFWLVRVVSSPFSLLRVDGSRDSADGPGRQDHRTAYIHLRQPKAIVGEEPQPAALSCGVEEFRLQIIDASKQNFPGTIKGEECGRH